MNSLIIKKWMVNWYSLDIKTDKDELPNDGSIVKAIEELEKLTSFTKEINYE